MSRSVPISVAGLAVAFAMLGGSAAWLAIAPSDYAAFFLLAGIAVLGSCAVWTSISVLRKGRVYHWLRPQSRPRRWVLFLLMFTFSIFVVWFPVWMIWPHAFISRVLTLLFGIVFFVTCLAIKWFSHLVDRQVRKAGWQLR